MVEIIIPLNEGMIKNTLGKMWNEAMVAQFGALSLHLLGVEENDKKFKVTHILDKVSPGNLPNTFRSVNILAKFLGNISHVK
jgi:hypothetical protein